MNNVFINSEKKKLTFIIIIIKYDPRKIINVESSWKIAADNEMTNLTGLVTISSPFKGFQKGLMVSKIYVTKSRSIRGIADLDVDHRKFRAIVDGINHKIQPHHEKLNYMY